MKGLRAYILLAAMAVCGCLCLRAQTDAQFSQYWQVPTYYNPAAAGSTPLLRLNAGGRLQWVGIHGAPKSFAVTGDMPWTLFKKQIGLGVVLSQESIGLFRTMDIGAQVAYKMKLFGGSLSIGAQIGYYDQKFKGTEVLIPDEDDFHQSGDQAIPTQDLHGSALDLGAGIWYERKGLWAGVSGTHLNSPTVTLNTDTGEGGGGEQVDKYQFQAGRTMYIIAGYNIKIKNTLFEVLPSAMAKTDFTFWTWEAGARVRYNRFLTLGVGYRYKDAMVFSLGAEIKGFTLGYSYDYATTAIAKASSGTHELWLGYSLKIDTGGKNRHRHKSIRIM